MNRATSMAALLGAVLAATVMPASAGAQSDPAGTSPEGVEWRLAEFPTDGAPQPVPAGITATMLLENGQVTGSAGCNSFFGTYQIDGSSISLDEGLGRTEMYCEGDAQVVEDAYLAVLPTITSWSMDGAGLALHADDDVPALAFTAPGTDIDEADLTAVLEALRLEVLDLQERVSALEAGATPGDAPTTAKARKPKAPRVEGKVSTSFPEWMRDEFRPEAERSDERNRESVSWVDRSDNEDAFNVYARRGFCAPRKGVDTDRPLTSKDFRTGHGKTVLIETLPADSTSYRPDHAGIDAQLPQRDETGYSNDQFYDLFVAAANEQGESKPVLVGSYFLTPEFLCP